MLRVEIRELKMALGRILKAGERLLTLLSPSLRVKQFERRLMDFHEMLYYGIVREDLSNHFSFYLNRTILIITLHEDLYDFLRISRVTRLIFV